MLAPDAMADPAAARGWQNLSETPGLSREERAGAKFLAGVLEFEHYDVLEPDYQRRLLRYAADHRDGDPSLVLCWGSNTAREIVAAFRAVEVASTKIRRERKREIAIGTAFQADLSDHWASTASDGGSVGDQGRPVTLTWSFVPDGTIIPGGQVTGEATNDGSDLRAWLATIYGGSATDPAAAQPWFPVFQAVFDNIAAKTGVRYVYEPNDDGAGLSSLSQGSGSLGVRGDVRISGHALDGNSNVLAYNYFPDYAEMIIDTSDSFYNDTSNNSLRLRNVVEHEHGHGLGLGHVCPVDNTKLMEPFINLGFTGIQFDDIYTTQRLYGDPLEVHGTEQDNDSASRATFVSTPVNVPFIAEWVGIDDNLDSDFYQFDVPAGSQLTVRVIPSSNIYLEGEQNSTTGDCTAGTAFNSGTIHDLAFVILGPDQGTVLATGNSQAVGVAEMVEDLPINTAGRHYLQVTGGSADSNQLYRLEIEVNASSVAIQLTSATMKRELFQGQNGVPDPGETVELEIGLKNVGLLDGTNIVATLTTPAGVQGFQTVQNYGDLANGAGNTGLFIFAADGTCGDQVNLQLNLVADGGYAASIPIPVVLGLEQASFNQNFDASSSIPNGWSSGATGKGSQWSVVTTAVNSAPNAMFAQDKSQFGSSTLTSPPVAIGSNPGTLSFSHHYDTEAGWDGGVLEMKIGAGAWQDIIDAGGVFLSGAYNLALGGTKNPLAGRSGWSGDSGGFITTTVALPLAAANQSVTFRMIIGHDNRAAENGWFIDDVIHRAFSCDPLVIDLALSSNDASTSEYHASTDTAEIRVSALLPVPIDIPVSLQASGTADPVDDVTGFGDLTLATGNSSASTTVAAISDGLAEGDETLEVSSSEATGTVSITVVDTPYGTWATTTFGGLGQTGPFEDFDQDGSLNIEELVFGTDATLAGSQPMNQLLADGPDFKLPVPLDTLPEGVFVLGESSLDLQLWSIDDVTVLPQGFLIPGGNEKRFLRLVYSFLESEP